MFGRRRRAKHDRLAEELTDALSADPGSDDDADGAAEVEAGGPYDGEPPDDGRGRLDLGSLRLPVPDGAQLQVEVDKSGPVRAVHVKTALGQLTVTAFAAPRSGGLWAEVSGELVTRLTKEGAQVRLHDGEWGREIEAVTAASTLRFLAVDGPRWMLRGVSVATAEGAEQAAEVLRDVVRETVVVRGVDPLPPRSPLPLTLPETLAEQLKAAAAAQGGNTAPPG